MKNLERTLKALANKRRLAILEYLKGKKEASVGEVAGAIHLSLKSTSRHLAILAATDIVEKDQRGLMVFYYLLASQAPAVKSIIALLWSWVPRWIDETKLEYETPPNGERKIYKIKT